MKTKQKIEVGDIFIHKGYCCELHTKNVFRFEKDKGFRVCYNWSIPEAQKQGKKIGITTEKHDQDTLRTSAEIKELKESIKSDYVPKTKVRGLLNSGNDFQQVVNGIRRLLEDID